MKEIKVEEDSKIAETKITVRTRNDAIVARLKSLVCEERKITAEILNYLRQVEELKIFAQMAYPSLFEFCVKELNYSEGAAQRRISAMRLIREIPEIEEKIVSGALSLSVVSQAQTFFKTKKSLHRPMKSLEKMELLAQLENSSTRECEKALIQLEPDFAARDRERFINLETVEIKISVSAEFMRNVEILKNRLSHKMPLASTKDILAYALAEMVKRTDVSVTREKKPRELARSQDWASPPAPAVDKINDLPLVKKPTRYISARVRRHVWQKSQGRCEYQDRLSRRQCGAQRYLEVDHVIAYSRGGLNSSENLQLLCDVHNRLKGDG